MRVRGRREYRTGGRTPSEKRATAIYLQRGNGNGNPTTNTDISPTSFGEDIEGARKKRQLEKFPTA